MELRNLIICLKRRSLFCRISVDTKNFYKTGYFNRSDHEKVKLVLRKQGAVEHTKFVNYILPKKKNKKKTGDLMWELIFYLLRTFCPHLGSFFVLFLLSLRFGQISPLAFFRWFTATSDRNAESCNRIPSNCSLP